MGTSGSSPRRSRSCSSCTPISVAAAAGVAKVAGIVGDKPPERLGSESEAAHDGSEEPPRGSEEAFASGPGQDGSGRP